jgi:hypothetical protein
MWHELVKGDREVVVFLLDHHPVDSRYIASNVIVGCGWDDYEGVKSIRWFGEGYSPDGTGSSLVDHNPEVAMVLFSNRLARTSLTLEKKTGKNVWSFAQPHIITTKDSEKLFRYMGNYTRNLTKSY